MEGELNVTEAVPLIVLKQLRRVYNTRQQKHRSPLWRWSKYNEIMVTPYRNLCLDFDRF